MEADNLTIGGIWKYLIKFLIIVDFISTRQEFTF